MEHIVLVNSLSDRFVTTTGWTTSPPPSQTYLHIRSLISYWQKKNNFTAAPKCVLFPRARSTSWKQTFFVVVQQFSRDRNKQAREKMVPDISSCGLFTFHFLSEHSCLPEPDIWRCLQTKPGQPTQSLMLHSCAPRRSSKICQES